MDSTLSKCKTNVLWHVINHSLTKNDKFNNKITEVKHLFYAFNVYGANISAIDTAGSVKKKYQTN